MPIVPWLTEPVTLHSSRNPGMCTMTPEQCAYKKQYWLFWYQADRRYGLPTVAFFMVAIILFTLAHWVSLFAPQSLKRRSGWWARLAAIFRVLAYKKWRVMAHSTQSVGALLLAAVGVVFFLAMTLGPHPYYWPNTMTLSFGDSPPIATRAGFMALACMPFIYILATKANPITLFTGISHEKLISWHFWAAWAMFVLALVHTFPFIVYHRWKGDLVVQWNDGGMWVTGVVALLAQTWLTFASIPWLRNRYYEFFKSTHHFAAMVFVVFFFLHCNHTLSSWDYFIVTAVLYALSWCYSQCKTYFEYGVRHKARLQPETNDMLKITISSTKAQWTAGQHIFLRFLTGSVPHMLTAHPFTICSVPKFDAHTNDLVFYIRPRGGLTKSLMALATKQPNIQVPVLMDGPYGGTPTAQLDSSDQCLVIGGGAGAGLTLSIIEHYIRNHAITGSASKKGLKVIVATRELDMRLWYAEGLRNIYNRYPGFDAAVAGLSIDIHETGETSGSTSPAESSKQLDVEKALDSTTVQLQNEEDRSQEDENSITRIFNVTFFKGRPNLPVAVQQFVAREESVTAGLIVCGPSSMSHDVGEAAVSAQQQILKGQISAKEVWYHAESFSY